MWLNFVVFLLIFFTKFYSKAKVSWTHILSRYKIGFSRQGLYDILEKNSHKHRSSYSTYKGSYSKKKRQRKMPCLWSYYREISKEISNKQEILIKYTLACFLFRRKGVFASSLQMSRVYCQGGYSIWLCGIYGLLFYPMMRFCLATGVSRLNPKMLRAPHSSKDCIPTLAQASYVIQYLRVILYTPPPRIWHWYKKILNGRFRET